MYRVFNGLSSCSRSWQLGGCCSTSNGSYEAKVTVSGCFSFTVLAAGELADFPWWCSMQCVSHSLCTGTFAWSLQALQVHLSIGYLRPPHCLCRALHNKPTRHVGVIRLQACLVTHWTQALPCLRHMDDLVSKWHSLSCAKAHACFRTGIQGLLLCSERLQDGGSRACQRG